MSAFISASRSGDVDTLTRMLASDAKVITDGGGKVAATLKEVLDTALAWSVINRHFDVADFLLEHGANINTDWNSPEPASILHHLVFLPNSYESMRYLIDRGIDMTIKDYRWISTAQGSTAKTRRWRSGWRRRNGNAI